MLIDQLLETIQADRLREIDVAKRARLVTTVDKAETPDPVVVRPTPSMSVGLDGRSIGPQARTASDPSA